MDDQVNELIAIGASVACNCHPCVKFHLEKAQNLNIYPELVMKALEVGKMVRKGAAGQMNEMLMSIQKT